MLKNRLRRWTFALALWCGCAALAGSVRAQAPEAPVPRQPERLAFTRSAGPLGASRTVSFDLPLSERQAVRLHAGYDDFSSFPRDASIQRFGRPTMKLRSVPIGVDYVVHLADPNRRIVPVASAGVSVNLSRLSVYAHDVLPPSASVAEAAAAIPFTAMASADPDKHSRMGVGYDVHAALGLRANLSRHVFVLGQARVRHLDALGFSKNDLAEFNKVDFVVGVGFRF